MEEEKRKVRICLLIVVALAVLMGCVYYFGGYDTAAEPMKGTLIEAPHGRM